MAQLNNFDEASEQLGVSSYTMRRWARQKLVETIKLGRRRLIPQEEIERIAREGLRTTEPGTASRAHANLNQTELVETLGGAAQHGGDGDAL